MFRSAFEGCSIEVLHQLADEEHVMTHQVSRGRHTGDLLGFPLTGRSVRFTVMDVVRIADGRIVEHWGLVDQPALLSQLQAGTTGTPGARARAGRTTAAKRHADVPSRAWHTQPRPAIPDGQEPVA